FQRPQHFSEQAEVPFPCGYEIVSMIQLRQANSGLHICNFQIITDMTICIFVVIAVRKGAQSASEPLPASIILAGSTPTIATPVPHRFHDALDARLVSIDCATLSHGDMMGGIEAQRTDVTESPHVATIISRSQCIATILDDPQIILFCDPHNLGKIKGIT